MFKRNAWEIMMVEIAQKTIEEIQAESDEKLKTS